ncbi:uncharacterized protein A4U43_C06F15220 [Asparagus officinalis]|uniref:DUF632 domain-containing protein n=1 Tax=Asparagus officinalis TaxID=4686 RepID=A0A5P1EPJ6_ASPOF|nr:uncharacterized protein A4U43_C06F15220 [Asparagus officinalis]
MGCKQSRNTQNDALSLCKERKKLIEEAIASWQALATAYSGYSLSLKNIGAALGDYSQGIINYIHQSSRKSSFSFQVLNPTNESPTFNIPTSPHFLLSPILEIEEESYGSNEATESTPLIVHNQEVHSQVDREHAKVITEIMNDLDQHFLESSKNAHQISEILEAPHIGYDSRIDYSATVMRALTWNSSSEGIASDDFDIHASIGEFEERLYKELKALGTMKYEYERKVASLRIKRKGASEKAKDKDYAEVTHFCTRYIVGKDSLQFVISEIEHIRDEVLYLKLLKLIDVMARMWQSMHEHHESQLKIVINHVSGALDKVLSPIVTSQQHWERSALLWELFKEWRSQFQKLVIHQMEYIEALYRWSGLTESRTFSNSLKEELLHKPIQHLLETWKEELEKVPYDLGSHAICCFSDVIHMIMVHQEDEMNLRKKCVETSKERISCAHVHRKIVMVETSKRTLEPRELFG